MVHFLLRLIGFVLLAAGFSAFVVDGTRSIAAGEVKTFSFAEAMAALAPSKLAALTVFLDHLGVAPLRGVALAFMALPTAALLCGLGILLLYVGRRPVPSVGYSIRG